jgi:hypothetical protein
MATVAKGCTGIAVSAPLPPHGRHPLDSTTVNVATSRGILQIQASAGEGGR